MNLSLWLLFNEISSWHSNECFYLVTPRLFKNPYTFDSRTSGELDRHSPPPFFTTVGMMNHYIYYRLILCSNVLNFAQVETEEWNDKVASALRNIYGEDNGIKAYFACIVLFNFKIFNFFFLVGLKSLEATDFSLAWGSLSLSQPRWVSLLLRDQPWHRSGQFNPKRGKLSTSITFLHIFCYKLPTPKSVTWTLWQQTSSTRIFNMKHSNSLWCVFIPTQVVITWSLIFILFLPKKYALNNRDFKIFIYFICPVLCLHLHFAWVSLSIMQRLQRNWMADAVINTCRLSATTNERKYV